MDKINESLSLGMQDTKESCRGNRKQVDYHLKKRKSVTKPRKQYFSIAQKNGGQKGREDADIDRRSYYDCLGVTPVTASTGGKPDFSK